MTLSARYVKGIMTVAHGILGDWKGEQMFKYFFGQESVNAGSTPGPELPSTSHNIRSTLRITYLIGNDARDITYTIDVMEPGDDRPDVDETADGYRHWMTKHTLVWYDFFSWFFDTSEQVFIMKFRNGSAVYNRQYISTFSVHEETK